MKTLRSRLIFSHLLPLLVVMPIIGIIIFYLFQLQAGLADLRAQLENQTALVAEALREQEALWRDSARTQTLVNRLEARLSARVLILDASGSLLSSAGSDDDYPNVEGLAAVLAGEQVVTVHRRQGQDVDQLDILTPILDAEEQVTAIIRVIGDLSETSGQIADLRSLVWLALALATCIGLAIGVWLAFSLERVFTTVTDTVYEIARGEQPLLPQRGLKEIRTLYEAVNMLVARLQTLEDARRRLLANLVHELGRPLGAIGSAIYTLRNDQSENPDLRGDLLKGIDAEIQRMQPLLANLTQLHGQIMGSLELNRQSTSLSNWLPQTLAHWAALAGTEGIEWRLEVPDSLPSVRVDRDQLARAVGNLVNNAIKYTSSGGMVTVKVGKGEVAGSVPAVWIQVRDSGCGIPPDQQSIIFEPFQRGQVDRKFPRGMGLGLSIAHDIVKAHGGRIDVESEIGKGSTFTIVLPSENS